MRSYIFQIDPDHNNQAIHGIIGPGCSAAAIPVAELAHFFNLVLVSAVFVSACMVCMILVA